MIDTINLQLHDIKRHSEIYNTLRLIKNGFRKIDVNSTGGTLNHEVTFYELTGKEKDKFILRSRNIPSSHYKLIITADRTKDVINFNFSIPKYFYGHNIAQAVKNKNERGFDFAKIDFQYHIEEGFNRLIDYIKSFFDSEFPAHYLNYNKLELRRLDFCYNQVFKTKKDALDYLQAQRQIKKKYLRKNSGDSNNYKTSIFYSNQDYSVKIYHKGTEYAKNDAQEHMKINSKLKHDKFDVNYLQEFSDKILRYEITIRPSYMSYLFNYHIFRKKSNSFQKCKKLFSKLKALNKKNDGKIYASLKEKSVSYDDVIMNFRGVSINKYHKDILLFFYDYYTKRDNKEIPTKENLMRILDKFYLDFDKLMNTRRRFFFQLGFNDKMMFYEDNKTNFSLFHTERICIFDKEMYKLLSGKLVEFIYDMEVKSRSTLNTYLDKVDEYNRFIDDKKKTYKDVPEFVKGKPERKIDRTKIGLILSALETYQLHELKDYIGFSKSTFHYYKHQLALIGYNKNTVLITSPIPTRLDFYDYYQESVFNETKLFNNQFFRFAY